MTHLILLTILIAAAFAVYEARLIAKRIKEGDREELDHAELMVWRAALAKAKEQFGITPTP